MKKILFFLAILTLIFFFRFSDRGNKNQPKINQNPSPTFNFQHPTSNLQSPTYNIQFLTSNFSLFLPYWRLPENKEEVNLPQISNLQAQIANLIYFGIAPNETGIDKNEAGYLNLQKIKNLSQSLKIDSLSLRMTNADLNFKVLEDRELMTKIIDETIQITKESGFKEVVLDFEITALPFQSLTEKITEFVSFFSQKTKEKNIKLSMTIYADNFYRKRPYDLKNLTLLVEGLYVMTYDFHKAYGQPGPNFPLFGKEKYGYDLSQGAKDLLAFIPKEKLIFVLGLYGYDWLVDEKNRSIKMATALTLNQIKEKFLKNNHAVSLTRDPLSKEQKIEYYDENNQKHVLWFEDENSIKEKIDFLKSQGIDQFAFWAFGYY